LSTTNDDDAPLYIAALNSNGGSSVAANVLSRALRLRVFSRSAADTFRSDEDRKPADWQVIAARWPPRNSSSSTLSVRQLTPGETYAAARFLSDASSSPPLPRSDQDAARQLMEPIQSIIERWSPASAASVCLDRKLPVFRALLDVDRPVCCMECASAAAMALSVYGVAMHVAAAASRRARAAHLGESSHRNKSRASFPRVMTSASAPKK